MHIWLTFAIIKVLSDHYSFTLWLLVGGSLQIILGLLLRNCYAWAPVLLLLLLRGLRTTAISLGLQRNPYLEHVRFSRTAPQIPDADGHFDANIGAENVTVFLLGFKVNHPLGILAPHIHTINELNIRMWKELEETAPDSGYYGSSEWTCRDPRGALEVLTISYWRSIEDVHRFAYGPVHRKTWDYWNSHHKDLSHLGISHEMYEVPRHKWEGVYLNMQPTLLGANSYLRKGDKFVGGQVDDMWISGLLDATKGKLRTSAGRLGRDPKELYETFNDTPKEE